MAIACGIITPDGKVAVDLSWTSGSPDPVRERIVAAIYGGQQVEMVLEGPISPGVPRQVRMIGLLPGQTYAWTVQTTYTDGSIKDSLQGSFATPTILSISGATRLQAEILSNTPAEGATTKHTWVRGGPNISEEQFVLGPAGPDGRRTGITYAQTILPDEPAETEVPGLNTAVWAWEVVTKIRDQLLGSEIKALAIPPPPGPTDQPVMPISLWHAINYWVSWHRQANSPYINIGPEIPSRVDLMAAIAGAEVFGNPWVLNPCASGDGGASVGPYQERPGSDKPGLTRGQACTAWFSTKVAADMIFAGWPTGSKSRIGEWGVWPARALDFFNQNMQGQVWDGYGTGVHRASAGCFQGSPCGVGIVSLSPGDVTQEIDTQSDGSIRLTFLINNRSGVKAAYTVMALENIAGNYNILPGPDVWMPDWSGRIMLSPAIPEISGPGVGRLTIVLMPIRLPSAEIHYRVYGENIGTGVWDSSNSALGIFEGSVIPVLEPQVPELRSNGQELEATLQFSHQGSAATLDAEITVYATQSPETIIKRLDIPIRVANDPVAQRYQVGGINLGRVFATEPRGQWHGRVILRHNNRELVSDVKTNIYTIG